MNNKEKPVLAKKKKCIYKKKKNRKSIEIKLTKNVRSAQIERARLADTLKLEFEKFKEYKTLCFLFLQPYPMANAIYIYISSNRSLASVFCAFVNHFGA